MWDQRCAADEHACGTLPDDFLVSRVAALPRGRVPCLGKGEGLVIGHGVETVRTVVEGRLHNVDGAVAQVLVRRPA